MRQYLIALAMICVSVPAAATTAVIASNSGRECFIQMLREPTPDNNKRALAICYQAVKESGSGDDIHNHAASLVNLSAVHLRMRDYADAISEATKAIAIYPGMAQAHANLGAGLLGLSRYKEALGALDTAISLDVDEAERVYYNRGLVKEYLGDIRGAYYDYRQATQINPKFLPAAEELTRFKVTIKSS